MHFARRRQQPMMVAIGKHAPFASRDPIHRPRQPRTDRFHAAAERDGILRLDDQVCVIPLQRVVHESKAGSYATVGKRPFDFSHDRHRS